MRVKLVIDLELAEGKRPGTRYGWAERVARTVGSFAGRMSPVRRLVSVELRQPADGERPETVLMAIEGSELVPDWVFANRT